MKLDKIPEWMRLTLGAVASRFKHDTKIQLGSICFWTLPACVSRQCCTRAASFPILGQAGASDLLEAGASDLLEAGASDLLEAGAMPKVQEPMRLCRSSEGRRVGTEMAAGTCS